MSSPSRMVPMAPDPAASAGRSPRFVAATAAVVLLGVVAGHALARTDGAAGPEGRGVTAGSSAGERIQGAGIRYQAFGPGGPTRTLTIASPDQGDVIVKLNGRPLAEEWRAARHELVASEGGVAHRRLRRRMPASVAQAAERLRMQHQRVADALASFDAQEQATRGRIGPSRIRFRFTRTFNGLVVRASARVVERLRQHPDVESVRPAVRVEKALAESTVTIGAPELWSRGLTGAGVVVGVIDSGVDYTHPDLGGGYGPSFKVIGGYDFVNDDDDPRDDNGHGTHVAGIIAANGEVKGVAPDARIMAYKVLDAGGGGWDSDVIQALERACDPDGDPMTDDAVDVVNLSLGGPGTPDDPLSQAVDNAFAAGVLVVVAAGNEGHAGGRTIGSPGCARNALTVGASDDAERIASFSSTGPTDFTHAIKPDLVAPGVAIRSTFPGGAYATLDGTSMASPHVAAAAALLLQQEPSLTAALLKSRLMLSSRDIGASLYAQGSGRLDLPAALDLRTTVVPASISFGLDEPARSQFTGIAVLEVTNETATARHYSVSPDHEMPEGVMLSVAPSSFSLAPGATARVFVGIQVDNSVVPDVPEPPFGYTGNLRVASEGEELRVPFSFVKSPCLRLAFDATVDSARAYDEDGRRWSLWLPPGGATMLLPKGQYRLVVQGTEYPANGAVRPWQVLREGVAVPGEVSIRRAEARHVVRTAARAIDGAGMRGGWRYTLRTPVAGVRFRNASRELQGRRVRHLGCGGGLPPRLAVRLVVHARQAHPLVALQGIARWPRPHERPIRAPGGAGPLRRRPDGAEALPLRRRRESRWASRCSGRSRISNRPAASISWARTIPRPWCRASSSVSGRARRTTRPHCCSRRWSGPRASTWSCR